MHHAERYIRERIKDITTVSASTLRLMDDIRRDLRYSLWHGFINEVTYDTLLAEIDAKYSAVCCKHFEKIAAEYDKHLQYMLVEKSQV